MYKLCKKRWADYTIFDKGIAICDSTKRRINMTAQEQQPRESQNRSAGKEEIPNESPIERALRLRIERIGKEQASSGSAGKEKIPNESPIERALRLRIERIGVEAVPKTDGAQQQIAEILAKKPNAQVEKPTESTEDQDRAAELPEEIKEEIKTAAPADGGQPAIPKEVTAQAPAAAPVPSAPKVELELVPAPVPVAKRRSLLSKVRGLFGGGGKKPEPAAEQSSVVPPTGTAAEVKSTAKPIGQLSLPELEILDRDLIKGLSKEEREDLFLEAKQIIDKWLETMTDAKKEEVKNNDLLLARVLIATKIDILEKRKQQASEQQQIAPQGPEKSAEAGEKKEPTPEELVAAFHAITDQVPAETRDAFIKEARGMTAEEEKAMTLEQRANYIPGRDDLGRDLVNAQKLFEEQQAKSATATETTEGKQPTGQEAKPEKIDFAKLTLEQVKSLTPEQVKEIMQGGGFKPEEIEKLIGDEDGAVDGLSEDDLKDPKKIELAIFEVRRNFLMEKKTAQEQQI